MKLSKDERLAIASLHRLAKRWPKTLWLHSNGTLTVMKKLPDGRRSDLGEGNGYNTDYCLDTIDIESDGSDW